MSYEVTKVFFLENEKLLITVGCDSVVRVYDSQEGEDAFILREFRGGHLENEITTAFYSQETLALVTGAYNGTVCYWNFENSKLEFLYYDQPFEITSVAIAYPYKVILSTNTQGYLYAWKMKFNKKSYPCLFKMDMRQGYYEDKTFLVTDMIVKNFSWDAQKDLSIFETERGKQGTEYNKFGATTGFDFGRWKDNTLDRNNKFSIQEKVDLGSTSIKAREYYDKVLKLNNSNIISTEDLRYPQSKYSRKPIQSKKSRILTGKVSGSSSMYNSQVLQKDTAKNTKKQMPYPSLDQLQNVHCTSYRSMKDRFKRHLDDIFDGEASKSKQADKTRYLKCYEDIVDQLQLPDHTLIFITDSKGWVKVINLSALLTGAEIDMFRQVSPNLDFNTFLNTQYRSYLFKNKGKYFDFQSGMFNTLEFNPERWTKFSLALKRKDSIFVSKSSENYYKVCQKVLERTNPPILLASPVTRNSWHAHPYKVINKLNFVEQMEVLVTCSEDKFVKIWSRHGFLHSKINIVSF